MRFIDDVSKFCYVVLEKIKIDKTKVENLCNTKIICIRCNRGGDKKGLTQLRPIPSVVLNIASSTNISESFLAHIYILFVIDQITFYSFIS